MRGRLLALRASAPLATVVAALGFVATLGFETLFGTWQFVAYAAAGAATALMVALLARLIRLTAGETLALSIVAFVVVGVTATQAGLAIGDVRTFAEGAIAGWARALSALPPLALTPDLRVLPFAAAWLGTTVGIELLRFRSPGVPVLGPLVTLVITVLMSFDEPKVALAQGAVLAAGALLLAFFQQRRVGHRRERHSDPTISGVPRLGGLLSAVAMLALAATGAWTLGPRAPLVGAHERFDLRDYQDPPFDPLREPSPLSQVKAGLQEQNADRIVFSVVADGPVNRFPLAVLDAYNGEFWSVVDELTDAPAQFVPVDSTFPGPPDAPIEGWSRVTATIEIGELDQLSGGDVDPVWLPTAGWPLLITGTGPLDLRFNPRTGTVALAPDGPAAGMRYEVVAAVAPDLEEVNLRGASVTAVRPYDLAVPQLGQFADDVLEGADDGWEQVESIRTALADQGAYDSREFSPSARPGHSLARLANFVSDPEALAGFEEQYAAAAALVARSEGLPVRVVVGFLVPTDQLDERLDGNRLDVLANDISAWIEVRFDGVGWLPFDVTPDRDRQPQDRPLGRSERAVALPNPPPPPPPPLDPPPAAPDIELDDELEEEAELDTTGGLSVGTIAVISTGAAPFLALGGAAIWVVAAKGRRRRRRRSDPAPSRRIAGAWYEAVDRFAERGVGPPRFATPLEYARGLIAAGAVSDEQGHDLLSLAERSNSAAYHPEPATEATAAWAWDVSDRIVEQTRRDQRPLVRTRQRLDPRPLLRHDPLATSGAER